VAFRQFYDVLSGAIQRLLGSKEANERQIGEMLASVEYENVMTALSLALDAQVSILNPYSALSIYLRTIKDERRILALGEAVLPRLRAYPSEVLGGEIGEELVRIVGDIGNRQLSLRQYTLAEASYRELFGLLDAQTAISHEDKEKLKASIYHQLGRVAQEQRQWEQAEQCYQQALDIKIEFNDRYSQASTYHQLGGVAQEQRQWEQARDFFLKGLEITSEFNDKPVLAITLRSLARLWQASGDTDLPHAIGSILNFTPEEAETLLSSLLSKQS
jgi:tetratricopeptide (TPR) repeat protein